MHSFLSWPWQASLTRLRRNTFFSMEQYILFIYYYFIKACSQNVLENRIAQRSEATQVQQQTLFLYWARQLKLKNIASSQHCDHNITTSQIVWPSHNILLYVNVKPWWNKIDFQIYSQASVQTAEFWLNQRVPICKDHN